MLGIACTLLRPLRALIHPSSRFSCGASRSGQRAGIRDGHQDLAFNLDLRFYSISEEDATVGRPPNPQMRLFVLGAGVSIR